MKNNSKGIGTKTEAILLAELVKNGYTVLQPFGDCHPYDLAIDIDGHLVRIQCKTGRFKNGCVIADAKVVGHNLNRTITRKYEVEEFDFFGIYCPVLDRLFMVPHTHVRAEIRLRVDPPKLNSPSIRWADDHEFSCWHSTNTNKEQDKRK